MQSCLVGRVVAELGLGEPAQVDVEDAVGHLRLAIHLRVAGRAEAELDAGETEQLRPKGAGEHRIPLAHYGTGQSMEANDLVKEGLGDRRRTVQVAKGDEMRILGEAIDHRQYH